MVFLDVQATFQETKLQVHAVDATPAQPTSWHGDTALRSQVDELRRELLWVRRVQEDEKEEWLRERDGMQQVIDDQRAQLSVKDELVVKQKDEIGRLYKLLEQLSETDAAKLRADYDEREAALKSECRKRLRQGKAEVERLQRVNAELQQRLAVQQELNASAGGLQEECNQLVRRVVELTEDNWRQEQAVQALENKLTTSSRGSPRSPLSRQNSPDSDGFEGLARRAKPGTALAQDVKHTTQSVLEHSLRHAMAQQQELQELRAAVAQLTAENATLRRDPAPVATDRQSAA